MNCELCGKELTSDDGVKLCGTCIARKPDLCLKDLGATAYDSTGNLISNPACPLCGTKWMEEGLCEHAYVSDYQPGACEPSDNVVVETVMFKGGVPNQNGDVYREEDVVKLFGIKTVTHDNKPATLLGQVEKWTPYGVCDPERVYSMGVGKVPSQFPFIPKKRDS